MHAVSCQPFMLHSHFHHSTQLPALDNNNWQSPFHTIPHKCYWADINMTFHVALSTEHEVQRPSIPGICLYGMSLHSPCHCRDCGGSKHFVQRCCGRQAADLSAMLMLSAGVDTSCKTAFVMSLLAELVAKGHRTLIFSQSRVMLDILQAAIVEQSYAFRRIDGSISSAAERQVSVCMCMPAVCNLACRLIPCKAPRQAAVW